MLGGTANTGDKNPFFLGDGIEKFPLCVKEKVTPLCCILKKRGQPLNQDKLTVISSTLFLESTIVEFGKTYPPSLISARCCVKKDSIIFNTQRPRHNISSNIGFVLIQGLTPSFHISPSHLHL